MRTKRKHTQRNSDTSSFAMLFKGCSLGLLVSLAAGLAVLCIAAAFSLSKQDPEGIILPLSGFLLFPCSMLGGYLSCKISRDSPLLCGLVFGGMVITLSVALYPLLRSTSDSHSALAFFGMRALLLLCCIAGCLLGAKSNDTKKRHRHKRR